MNNGENVNLIGLDVINDPVRTFDDFSHLIHVAFRHPSPR